LEPRHRLLLLLLVDYLEQHPRWLLQLVEDYLDLWRQLQLQPLGVCLVQLRLPLLPVDYLVQRLLQVEVSLVPSLLLLLRLEVYLVQLRQ